VVIEMSVQEIWEIEEDYEVVNGLNMRVYKIRIHTKDGLVFVVKRYEGESDDDFLDRIKRLEDRFKPAKEKRESGR
jgi:23S rRNA U2552 (ribose-2'-O)-methylase RlmE/FtsJ